MRLTGRRSGGPPPWTQNRYSIQVQYIILMSFALFFVPILCQFFRRGGDFGQGEGRDAAPLSDTVLRASGMAEQVEVQGGNERKLLGFVDI
jgi:hypothetical protein